MDWSELNRKSKVKLECCNSKGFLDITAKSNNINTAIEKALDKLYFNYDGNKFITIEVNRTILILDRFDDSSSTTFNVMGRRYKSGSDIFLTRTINLGRINTEHWEDYQMFLSQMTALVKCWIELVRKDKEIRSDYLW